MNEADRARLQHMLDAAHRVERLVEDRTQAELQSDEVLADAVIWRLTVIGEAAARVSDEERAGLPAIPWGAIVGMRNRLVHGYDTIRFDLVWDVVTQHLPVLIAALEPVLARDEANENT